ncbi:MAG: Bro-N domain-containing protein [Bacteroidales bacterium]|nr:Bro-N domain-containing protein [Bacteroidales bacterium]
MNQLSIIQHPDFGQIRTENIDNEPIFCALDVCRSLEMSDTEVTLRKLDDDEKLMRKIYVSGQNREMWFVNESGLYNLIFRSNKPSAKIFRKWVTNEVLPSIRKTGSYHVEPRYGQTLLTRGELQNETLNFSSAVLPEIAKIEQGPLRNRLAGLVSYYINKIS